MGNFWRHSHRRLKQPASAADVFYTTFYRQKYVSDNKVIILGKEARVSLMRLFIVSGVLKKEKDRFD